MDYFNTRGLPDSIVFFEGKAAGNRFLFHYDESDQVALISGAVYQTPIRNELEYTDEYCIIHTYIRPEDSFVSTQHTIFKAGKPALEYTIEGLSKDTSEIIYYNKKGKVQ